jgi:hypothetical protein
MAGTDLNLEILAVLAVSLPFYLKIVISPWYAVHIRKIKRFLLGH